MDLKIKDVAEFLNVSETTIRRWLSEGKIPAYRLNHQYRFSRIEIENWMMSCRLQKGNKQFSSHKEALSYPSKDQKKKEDQKGMQQFSLYRAIHIGGVYSNFISETKESLINETMSVVSENLNLDAEVLTDLLLDREKLMPTALNNGFAVPHTREVLQEGTNDMVVVVFPKKPIEWGALDKKPVHTLFFLFAYDDKRHLNLLAKLAHLSSNERAIELLRSKPEKNEILSFVKECEIHT